MVAGVTTMKVKVNEDKTYSVREAAELFGITPGRVRQILTVEAPDADIAIGSKFGFMWQLSAADIRKLCWFTRQIPSRH